MCENYLQKLCFSNYLKTSLSTTLLIVWIMCQSAFGQTTEFVPTSLSLITVDVSTSSYKDFFTTGTQKSSALAILRTRNNVDNTAVTGSVSYEKTLTRLHFQYGLFESINFGITLPYLTSERKSNLIVNDIAEETFAENIGNAKASGLGDAEIWGIWQLLYTDQTDFQFGFKLVGDNAPLNMDVNTKMPLGSGSKELSLFFHWYVFSIQSSLKMFMKIEYVLAEDSKIKDASGQEIVKQQSNDFAAKFEVSAHSDQFGYGGGTRMQSVASRNLDNVSQNDGYLSYALRGYLSYGNRYLLETRVINSPWEARMEVEKVITGSNAPDVQSISLQFMTYF